MKKPILDFLRPKTPIPASKKLFAVKQEDLNLYRIYKMGSGDIIISEPLFDLLLHSLIELADNDSKEDRKELAVRVVRTMKQSTGVKDV